MKQIYLVNTSIEPVFLDPQFQKTRRDDAILQHNQFSKRVLMDVPGFGAAPYIALLSDGAVRIPFDLIDVGVSGKVQGDKATFGTGTLRLDDFIAQVIEGSAELPTRAKINTIVEFSPEELYPAAMRLLAQKYHISHIRVD
jgi:hypothetical protein